MKISSKLISSILVLLVFCTLASGQYTWASLEAGDLLWSSDIGLWSNVEDGSRVHTSRFNAGNLLLAARYGLLGDTRVEQVLQALYDMQNSDGAIKTCYEDNDIEDSNSSFFVCRKLILLKLVYDTELSTASHTILDNLFSRFHIRFYQQSMLSESARYPNKYLGDLVNAKLIQEMYSMSGQEVSDVESKMLEAAAYWRDNEWGWGEHLSDTYGATCMDLISEYLLFTNNASSQIYAEYTDLLNELLYIEDSFGGNPRVPAIRSYAFTARGPLENYRDNIEPWQSSMGDISNHFWRNGALISAIFYENNWHSLPASRAVEADELQIPCFGGTTAYADIEDDIRLGSMSKYPIMDDTEYSTWGLLWQSFPVAMWKPEGDWGFLQWRTVEDGQTRAHPVDERGDAVQLTSDFDPPLFGETYSCQKDGNMLALRIMPFIAESWTQMSDVFKLVNDTSVVSRNNIGDNFSQLKLSYPQRTVSVGLSTLTTAGQSYFTFIGNAMYWGTTYPDAQLEQTASTIHLWSMSLNGEITAAPIIETVVSDPQRLPHEQVKEVIFEWGSGKRWKAVIDPLAAEPLVVDTDYIDFDGGEGTPENPWLISNEQQLNKINSDITASYALSADIELANVYTDSVIASSQDNSVIFTGRFNGNGWTISNLNIDGGEKSNIALFGNLGEGGVVRDLRIEGVNVDGSNCVGSLVGRSNGVISDCFIDGDQSIVTGDQFVGGLVGIALTKSQISGCYTDVEVQASNSRVGGLVGQTSGSIVDCYALGNVQAAAVSAWNQSGGLIGWNEGADIIDCYAAGDVSGYGQRIGGLVGQSNGGRIVNCYARGNAAHLGTDTGIVNVGGLVGQSTADISFSYSLGSVDGSQGQRVGGLAGYAGGSINNCYATGSVNDASVAGGLVGLTQDCVMSYSYATGAVNGTNTLGGLIGQLYSGGPLVNCLWDVQTTGLAAVVGSGNITGSTVAGKTTVEMKEIQTFIDFGWDISGTNQKVWFMPSRYTEEVTGYPILSWQLDIHPSDFNKDGVVDIYDLGVFMNCWLETF
ncbi:MAG: GLUG motif-containing protein [Sedimentisphaeraceae bacterium JB056]